jgi:hypothetical protein
MRTDYVMRHGDGDGMGIDGMGIGDGGRRGTVMCMVWCGCLHSSITKDVDDGWWL